MLLGVVNPSGKLSETFPQRLKDTPAYEDFPGEPAHCLYGERLWTGYRWYDARDIEPLFPFGHGLSYTTFDYFDLTVDKSRFSDTDTLTVSLGVRNTGDCAGQEVVQLYLHEHQPRLHRPEKELEAFAKVSLQPGEERHVEFVLSGRDFALYNPTAGAWTTSSGVFDVLVGASSRDIRLRTSVTLESTSMRVEKLDRLSPIAQWMSHSIGQSLLMPRLVALAEAMGATSPLSDSPMMEAMMNELPVAKLVNFGAFSEDDLEDMIDAANSPQDG